ncbi:MAG: glycosyltransferase family 39 protein, partial [Ignavibacteria bacterium]|nr:glycosyltransferase family 39 protein [Ignavibacteria bacterium]
LLGLVIGIGLMNKIGFLWLGFGFFAGLLFTEKRYELRTLKPYLTALIALTIFSPYVIWNYQNNFAHLEFIQNASSGKYSNLDYLDFVKGQLMNMNPFSAIIWLSGIYYFFFNPEGKKFKILGIIYLTSFLILLLNNHSKAGYLAPAYTILLAGGAVLIEKKTLVRFRWVRFVLITLILTTGILISPLALPILPVNNYINYAATLGVKPETAENKELSELPQFFADMHGWEEMAANVSKVYMSLPREERLRTIVFGQNYGEASAMEFYKNKYPIPRVISSHNSYWTWGYPEIENPVFIIIGGKQEDHLEDFDYVEEAAVHTAEYSMPYENNISIFIAKNLKVKLQDVWNNIKHYD